uniref:Protein tyrosine phosphatase n=1 Tax=Panagrolaimus sp. JU765 TaxID=591449 RepID=A0AC34PY01_9BILA
MQRQSKPKEKKQSGQIGQKKKKTIRTRNVDDGSQKKIKGSKNKETKTTIKESELEPTDPLTEQTAKQTQASNLDRDKPANPQQKLCFEEFTREAVNKGVKGILEEYHSQLKPFIPAGITKKAFETNPKKNRYTDVICTDATRVVLRNHQCDYIHANWVRGDPLINSFICTQGPMMDTVKDFWKMVSQEHVGNIIMLCDTVEQGKDKCQQYWPREEGCIVEWPGIQVKNVKVDNSDTTAVVSTLELVIDKKEKMVLKHHHWRTWPDKSVPQSVLAPFRLLKNVRHSPRPTVVHCSAGIGRTGSIVALEMCYQQLLSENKLFVLDVVKILRYFRMHSVQTDLQYLYLFKCLLTFSHKNKTIPADCITKMDEFDKEYNALIEAKKAKEKVETYTPLTPIKFGQFAPIP